MLPSEKFRVLIVMGAILLVYGQAAAWLLHGVWRRVSHNRKPVGRWVKWLRRAALAFAAGGMLCGTYAYFVEPYWPAVTHVRITTSRLSRGARPIRIVHFSDLHSEARVRLEGRLPGIIAELRPDIIVFTGDALNSREGLPAFRECMTRAAKLAPTFAVRGNFDVWYWRQIDLFGGTGVRELGPDVPAVVELAGARVCLIGVPVGEEDRAEEAIRRAPDDLPTVFLYHYPDLMPEVASLDRVTLYCAGHTHGGQVALPGYGALVTLSRFGKRFEAGLYREGTTWLYVNRGIGMEGGSVPRVRFMSRPEITLIELCPE